MKKITNFIVEKRIIILIFFIIITGICLFTSTKVNINSDITKYLPESSETKIGKDIMDKEFDEIKSSSLNVMFRGLSKDDKKSILTKLESIKGVSSVDYDNTSNYNNGEYTLYVINVDDYVSSDTALNVYNEVNDNYDYEAMSGSIYNKYKPVLQIWIIFVAIAIAMVILTILSESYIEPWLYLTSIGIAVFINKGTNIIFPSVSNITDSITAILQLALSMDYSIMLSNRYRQEREKEKNKVVAMKNALYDSFKSISSSSITTVVGLLALVFMSFTIGKDLGIVLAKGVFLSLVSIFFCLPALLLMFDKFIINSKKKSINFNLRRIGKYSYKTRWVQLVGVILAFVVAYFMKNNLGILYTGSEQDEVAKQFPTTNQIAIIYENKYDDIITDYCKSIENDDKANKVLCYGNTINEKLAYDELNDKFKELGQDTEIDDYLIKIIYYNYYNKNTNNNMSLDEFINFIKSDIYSNDKISSSINKDVKNNIDLLNNFSNKNNINNKRSIEELSKILGVSKSDVEELLVLYNSKKLDTKMTIKDFINFILNVVSKNPNYKNSLDSNTINSLNRLLPFVDTSIINKEMNSSEIANTFGIDKNLVDQLFLFYRTTIDTDSKMTLNEFANVALSLKDNSNYNNMFDSETIKQLNILKTLTDKDIINNKYSANELASMFNKIGITELNSNTINLISFYNYYLNNKSDTKLSLNTFVKNVINDKSISSLLPSSINNYKLILNNFTDEQFINTDLNSNAMFNILKTFGFNENDIKLVYANIYKQLNPLATDEEAYLNEIVKISPYKYLSIVKCNLSSDDSRVNQINMLINIMDLSYNQTYKIVPTYSSSELANYLSMIDNNINSNTIALGYSYNDYKNSNYKMSIKEIINFLINNKDDEMISSYLSGNTDLLMLGYKIVNNIDKEYTYKEIATLINKEESLIKNIYSVYEANSKYMTFKPIDFVNFILNNKDNKLLNGKLDNNTLADLKLVKTVMESTINNSLYNASQISNILGSDKETISLVMSLYNSLYIKNNQSISLIDFTNFIISDVITNNKYSNKIDSNSKNKLIVINKVMNNSLKNTKYSSLELYSVLNKLSDGIDSNLIDLVYIYHGSKNNYDDNWKLTVEEIINYLNNDLLKDKKYNSFIDEDMNNKIINAKESINEAKNLLVTKNYSRAIINSKYALENEETFNFVQKTIDKVGKYDGVYVIGDSPMAVDISKSFNSELNYITILTMLFIFVVVSFTFKNLLIPFILVLIIQCAVYITMAILTVTGSNVYFIALLIVQAILMGATIDYAIVYTSYYKEMRDKLGVQDAMIEAYNKSIHTILSSSSILIIVTLVVASFAEAIPAKICETISQGTFASVILIVFVLPGVLATFDKFICNKNKIKK